MQQCTDNAKCVVMCGKGLVVNNGSCCNLGSGLLFGCIHHQLLSFTGNDGGSPLLLQDLPNVFICQYSHAAGASLLKGNFRDERELQSEL